MRNFFKTLLRIAAGLAILGFGLFVMNVLISMKPEPQVIERPVAARAVRTTDVYPRTCFPTIPVEGRVESLYRLEIMTETTGVLAMSRGKEFREGTEYRAGEVLLSLDATEAEEQLKSQRGRFLQLLSNALADLEYDFEGSWSKWDRFAASVQVDRKLPALPDPKSDQERLFLANRGIISTYHAIRAAEERLEKYTIKAPFNGTLASANVRPGGLVRAGQVAGVLLGQDEFEVKTAVHARYLDTVEKGDGVQFKDEQGNLVAAGQVHRVSGNIDAMTQSASVFCRVRAIKGKEDAVRDGRFLTGEIKSAPIQQSYLLSSNLLMEDGSVYIVEEEKLKTQSVQLLFESRTEVIVQGLKPGTQLLDEVLATAFDGMPVVTEKSQTN